MKPFFVALPALLAAGCLVGPDYRRPAPLATRPLPTAFGDSTVEWVPAHPAANQPRGSWWKVFADPELDRLETLASTNNQSLASTAAQLELVRARIQGVRAGFFPQISAQPGAVRQSTSQNAPVKGAPAAAAYTYTSLVAPLELGWELDLWGRVRRETEGARARFTAAADDLESGKLSLQAEVAADYFHLRALDEEHALVTDTIQAYRRSLDLTENRRKGGIVSDLDVSQAETQLRSAEAELPSLNLERANLLHALATLCGQPATGFVIVHPPSPLATAIPLPPSLPSELLERRPDIAAAERRMSAANAQIGEAKSAFYPRIFLNGIAGYQSVSASTWFDWPSHLWSIGPSLELPLFTGGRNRAQLAGARAAYEGAVANYRQSVLDAFQEVEDSLAAQHFLSAQLEAQNAALQAAQHTLEIANNRYHAGLVTYLEVATAQSVALARSRTVAQLRGRAQLAQVALIKALGGGWQQ